MPKEIPEYKWWFENAAIIQEASEQVSDIGQSDRSVSDKDIQRMIDLMMEIGISGVLISAAWACEQLGKDAKAYGDGPP